MKKSFLKSVLEVPSVSGSEHHMKAFILNFAKKHDLVYNEDRYGNVYILKGIELPNEKVPCVVAHMDTVQVGHHYHIRNNKTLNVVESKNSEGAIFVVDEKIPTGIGGDDKAGVAIALDIILKKDKIMGAFFREEEIGCLGSKALDIGLMSHAAYVMEFDAPSDNWISRVSNGVKLFNDEFYKKIKPVLKKYNQTRINYNDPFTDIQEIKKLIPVNCINIFAGYQYQHTSDEYVVIAHAQKAARLGAALITKLGNDVSTYEYELTLDL